jgi:hypothetical protein
MAAAARKPAIVSRNQNTAFAIDELIAAIRPSLLGALVRRRDQGRERLLRPWSLAAPHLSPPAGQAPTFLS